MWRVHWTMHRGWHSLSWMAAVSGVPATTVGSRIRDLRKPEGYEHIILVKRLRGGLHLYKMEEKPDEHV